MLLNYNMNGDSFKRADDGSRKEETMDIKDKIEDIVSKIKNDKKFAKKFKEDPIKAVESVFGIDLPDEQIKPLIEGIKAKIAGDKASGILGSIKKLF